VALLICWHIYSSQYPKLPLARLPGNHHEHADKHRYRQLATTAVIHFHTPQLSLVVAAEHLPMRMTLRLKCLLLISDFIFAIDFAGALLLLMLRR
jgi:hypothetical protein